MSRWIKIFLAVVIIMKFPFHVLSVIVNPYNLPVFIILIISSHQTPPLLQCWFSCTPQGYNNIINTGVNPWCKLPFPAEGLLHTLIDFFVPCNVIRYTVKKMSGAITIELVTRNMPYLCLLF